MRLTLITTAFILWVSAISADSDAVLATAVKEPGAQVTKSGWYTAH